MSPKSSNYETQIFNSIYKICWEIGRKPVITGFPVKNRKIGDRHRVRNVFLGGLQKTVFDFAVLFSNGFQKKQSSQPKKKVAI